MQYFKYVRFCFIFVKYYTQKKSKKRIKLKKKKPKEINSIL